MRTTVRGRVTGASLTSASLPDVSLTGAFLANASLTAVVRKRGDTP